MPRRIFPPITDALWLAAINDYELGQRSGRQIARDLGVSPATVSRRMKLRGAEKGSRVNENIKDLVAALDGKIRHAAQMRVHDSRRRRKVAETNMWAVGRMVGALLEADRQGDLALAAPMIDHVSDAVGIRPKLRARR